MKNTEKIFSLEALSVIVGMNKRTIRYYIQEGIVDRPNGAGKGAFYTRRHLEQLVSVRKWKEAGVSLERIKEILQKEYAPDNGGKPLPPLETSKAFSLGVWNRLQIAEGVEIHIDTFRTHLAPEQVIALYRQIKNTYTTIISSENMSEQFLAGANACRGEKSFAPTEVQNDVFD